MNKKILLCSDIDGTLYREINGEYVADENDIKAIKQFVNKGYDFALVSGRNVESCKEVSNEHQLNCSYIVTNSGSLVLDKNENKIYQEKILIDDVKTIIEIAKSCYIDSYEISNGALSTINIINPNNVSKESEYLASLDWFKANEEEIINKQVVYQMGVHFFDNFEQNKFINTLEQKKIKVICHINGLSVDITSSACSKYKAINFIQQKENYDHIFTIGDGLNDLEMIENYYGFAVENANKELKKKAKQIVKNIRECIDEIAKII